MGQSLRLAGQGVWDWEAGVAGSRGGNGELLGWLGMGGGVPRLNTNLVCGDWDWPERGETGTNEPGRGWGED